MATFVSGPDTIPAPKKSSTLLKPTTSGPLPSALIPVNPNVPVPLLLIPLLVTLSDAASRVPRVAGGTHRRES